MMRRYRASCSAGGSRCAAQSFTTSVVASVEGFSSSQSRIAARNAGSTAFGKAAAICSAKPGYSR